MSEATDKAGTPAEILPFPAATAQPLPPDPATLLERRKKAVEEQLRLFPAQTWRAARGDGSPDNPVRTWTHAPALPEICLELRAAITGQSDPLPDQFIKDCRDMLKARIDSWIPSKSTIDDAIKIMCVSAARLCKQEIERRDEINFHVN